MKRYALSIIILPALLFSLLSGCAMTNAVKDSGLTAYTHESPAFIVKYPKRWVERPLNGSEVLSVGQTYSVKDLPAMNVSVFDIPDGYQLSDLPGETENNLKRNIPWGAQFEKTIKDIKLDNGARAIACKYSWEWTGRPLRFFAFQVGAIKDNKVVIAFAVGARFPSVLKPLKRYAGSLQFIDPENPESHGVENAVEEEGTYGKDNGQDKNSIAEVKEKTTATKPVEPSLQINMPFSKMTSHDLKKLLISANARKNMASGIPTADGKVEVQGVLMKKRVIQLCEILEDVEALEKYEPEYDSDLPDTGFVVQNNTDRRVTMKIKGSSDKNMAVSAGESSAVALPEGTYEYSFSSDKDGSLKSFSGEKTILNKSRYLFKFYLSD